MTDGNAVQWPKKPFEIRFWPCCAKNIEQNQRWWHSNRSARQPPLAALGAHAEIVGCGD
jgi:hypothetical protein